MQPWNQIGFSVQIIALKSKLSPFSALSMKGNIEDAVEKIFKAVALCIDKLAIT
jgi:hypothetical protein